MIILCLLVLSGAWSSPWWSSDGPSKNQSPWGGYQEVQKNKFDNNLNSLIDLYRHKLGRVDNAGGALGDMVPM